MLIGSRSITLEWCCYLSLLSLQQAYDQLHTVASLASKTITFCITENINYGLVHAIMIIIWRNWFNLIWSSSYIMVVLYNRRLICIFWTETQNKLFCHTLFLWRSQFINETFSIIVKLYSKIICKRGWK